MKRSFLEVSGWVRPLMATFAVVLSTAALPLRADDAVPAGTVVPHVSCAADASFGYSVYLPSAYGANPERRWPVLYCFDPGARGIRPVEAFQAAAEKFGYIVAGSNNSKNGPWQESGKAIDAMMRDVTARFSIDRTRVYMTGFSGGARLAAQLAASGAARGVIACGGGFPDGAVPAEVRCLFLGATGVDDFNYPELRAVDAKLDKTGAIHRLLVFDGSHEWLKSDAAVEALEWMEIQSMRAGLRAPDVEIVKASYRRRLAALGALPAGERWIETKALAADFKGVVDTTALEKSVAELAKSKEVRDWQKEERGLARRQNTMIDALLGGQSGVPVENLRKQAALSEDSPERRLARRVLQGASIGAMESARAAMAAGEFETAIALLEMLTTLEPTRPTPHMDLAVARARGGDKKGALASLKDAAARGYKDAARLEREEAFSSMKNDPGFAEILAAVARNAEPQNATAATR